MNRKLYWKNRIPYFLLHILCMLLLSFFLTVTGESPDAVLFILLIWILLLLGCTAAGCHRRGRELDRLLQMAEQLKQRYLIAEIMEQPLRAEDQVFHRLLQLAGKSMLEEIGAVTRERTDYREYIEQWIHEIKTPITAMRLLCENDRTPFTRELLIQLEKTTGYTEQALYYARSEHTEKDFSVREIVLTDVVHRAVTDNRYLLRQEHVIVEVAESRQTVFSDEKWLRFILSQFLQNAVKYRRTDFANDSAGDADPPAVRFRTVQKGSIVLLSVSDNGIGIPESDLPRLFDKGFTGRNGRLRQGSTGLGLYLCKRLCDKLEIGLEVHSPADIVSGGAATSEADSHASTPGTTILLSFYVNHLIDQVQ